MAAAPQIVTLRKRAEFLSVAASGKKWVAPFFVLQIGAPHEAESGDALRVGFTATKKIGNAVIRNRAKRRLRALAQQTMPHAEPGRDYVFVARDKTAACLFADMRAELEKGLKRLKLWRD